MVYNFNLGIGWASSGVEYAQAYRAKVLREIGQPAKFIFTDMFPRDNIQHMTENIGFLDSEVIWLYTFFTDCKVSPVTFTLKQLEKTFSKKQFTCERKGDTAKYTFPGVNGYYMVYLVNKVENRVHRVEIVSNGCLIRKDYYTYCRIYSEYYAPLDNQAHLYQRRFFNEDGTVAYEEITDNDVVMYQFPDRLICSKEELVGYMVSRLKLTRKDVVIIDRTTGIGQAIIQNAYPARIGMVIHADHFSEGSTDEDHILWNNYYEYAFSQHKKVKFYVASTDAQNQLLKQQFKKYKCVNPKIVTIPVGSLSELKQPKKGRKKHSLITASRLADEKHVDWLIEAVAAAKESVPDISLDIYGKGGEEEKLKKLIERLDCGTYVRLCGQKNLDEVYKNYEAYLSGSTSEGFGLTLMEAVGSGLPIIGFDVRYGNPTFIDHGKNGYLIPIHDNMEKKERIQKLKECIVRLFTEENLEKFHKHSYEKAKSYLTEEVKKRMEKRIELNNALLLLDNYGQGSQSLHTSLKLAGYDCPAVVIEDNGFLPDDVMSVYGFFLGDFKAVLGKSAGPKYFNEIKVPEYWEISGTNSNGKVQDLNKERGKIFYAEPRHKRLVEIVDWYDERGVVRSSDHYNQYGAIYGRTIFNVNGQRVNKSYFSADGREVIVENFVTGDIILNEGNEVRIFRSKTDFVLHFFVRAGFKQSRIFFNSLSTPFFVSNRLQSKVKRDILFWQEPTGEEIPGNMQIIFNGEASRTATVVVQNRASYDRLVTLGAKKDMVKKLGFIYPFEKENTHQPEALICTNSDNIEHMEDIINGLPQMHFHIAALTEMSSKLTRLGSYDNVSLYPGVKPGMLDELFKKCDYYLDINHELEIVSAVRKAFLHNQLIFAFEETIHNRDYVADEYIYRKEDAAQMISAIRDTMSDETVLKEKLRKQGEAALVESVEDYQKL